MAGPWKTTKQAQGTSVIIRLKSRLLLCLGPKLKTWVCGGLTYKLLLITASEKR